MEKESSRSKKEVMARVAAAVIVGVALGGVIAQEAGLIPETPIDESTIKYPTPYVTPAGPSSELSPLVEVPKPMIQTPKNNSNLVIDIFYISLILILFLVFSRLRIKHTLT